MAATILNTVEADPRIKALRVKNVLWTKYVPSWKFFVSAYEGGYDFVSDPNNLFRHSREAMEDYKSRLERVHPANYCQPLVDFFTNFIFAESIDRNGGKNSTWYNDFVKDVDFKGGSVDSFMRVVSDDLQIFGMIYALADMPKFDPSVIISKADLDANNIKPYWVLIRPDEVTDWATDDFGVYVYIKRMQIVTTVVDGDLKKIERYTEFYQDHFALSEIDVTDETKPVMLKFREMTPNDLGVIPIAVAKYKPSKKDADMGVSFLCDFAYNNREINNLTSMLQEFLYRQAFNILAREVDGQIDLKDSFDGEIGTANVMDVPKGAAFPQYITPPVAPAQFIHNERTAIQQGMFTRASQDAMSELFNGQGSSGFSQAQSFSKTMPFIASRADTLEMFENELMRLTLMWLGKTWDGKVKYKDRYEITNLNDALTQFMTLARDLQLPSEAFVKAELKRLLHEFDGKLAPDVRVLVDQEIDAMDFDGWMETQKQALIGTPPQQGNSPGSQQKDKSTGTMAEAAAESKTGATKKVKGK